MTAVPWPLVLAPKPLDDPRIERLFTSTLLKVRDQADARAGHDVRARGRRIAHPPEVPAGAVPDPDRALVLDVLAEYPHGTQAFARLMERFWGPLWATCQSILLDEHDAEDAVQDAFLKAHRYLHSFRFEARFSTWLTRIARRESLTRLASRRRERSTIEAILDDPTMLGAWRPWKAPDPAGGARALRQALDHLDPDDRLILVLHELQGFAYEEIAEAMEISAGAARMRALRARGRLRDVLEPGAVQTT